MLGPNGGARGAGGSGAAPRPGRLLVRLIASPAGAAGWLPLRRLGHGGRGFHTAPVGVRVLPPGRRPRGASWALGPWSGVGRVAGWGARRAGLELRYPSGRGASLVRRRARCGMWRLQAKRGGNGQGAHGARKGRRIWRGSPRRVSRRCVVQRRRPFPMEGGGGLASRLCVARCCWIPWCRLRGRVSWRADTFHWPVAGREGGSEWVVPA